MKKSIDTEKQYTFPTEIVFIEHNNVFLVISPQTAKWIVLANQQQVGFFNLLQNANIKEALRLFDGEISDAKSVIRQIEARDFTNKNVISATNNNEKQLHFYLTNACNLHCPHCYMYSQNAYDDELSIDEISHVIDEYSKHGGKNLTLSGGEITMRKDLDQVISFASQLGLKVRLLTNGYAWSCSMIEKIAPQIASIQVSVDGFSEQSNAKVRGKGHFDKALQTIKKFLDYNVSVELALTPFYDEELELNIEKYAQFLKDLTQQFKGKPFKVNVAKQIIPGREVNLTEDDQSKYGNLITRLYKLYYGYEVEDYSFVNYFKNNYLMDNCMYGVYAIDARGDVFFCSRVSNLKPIGNVRSMDFDRITELSNKAQELSKIDNFKPCSACELKYICDGGCRIDYFPEFANIIDIESVDMTKIPARKCSETYKKQIYDTMIRCNELLFQ